MGRISGWGGFSGLGRCLFWEDLEEGRILRRGGSQVGLRRIFDCGGSWVEKDGKNVGLMRILGWGGCRIGEDVGMGRM